MKTCPVCDMDYPDQHTNCPIDGAVLIVSRELVAGSLVHGKYRIVRKLGEGGMGVVYLAEHILLGGQVALKFLAGDLSKDPKFIKRFRMEARAAHRLRHPNIVEVTDLDQSEDGSLFIAMEFVEGPNLREVLEGAPTGLATPRALELTRGIAAGLAAAHAHGTVHRDIKPENILLARTADGRELPKVLDFGIAAMAESATRASMTHGFLLTPDYAAPEQWREMPAAEMDGRTDLYALGCVFYEMLTGRTPLHAHNTSGWMNQHLGETPKPPSEVRPELADWDGLDRLVMRLLAKNRDDRPQDAELLSLLNALQHGSREERPKTVVVPRPEKTETLFEQDWGPEIPAPVSPPPPVVPAPKPGSRGFPGWAWGALAILAAAAGAALWLYMPHPQPQQAQAPAPQPVTAQQPVMAPPQPVQSPSTQEQQPAVAEEPKSVPAAAVKPAIEKPVSPQEKKPAQVADVKPPEVKPQEIKPPEVKPPEVKPQEIKPPVPELSSAEIEQQAISLYKGSRFAEAAALYDRNCTKGVPEACATLGLMYANGNGVAKDDTRAANFYSKACNGGDAVGCNNLGNNYWYGRGVTQDDTKAASLYLKSCQAGDAAGCSALGNSYWYGRGVVQDDTQAASLYMKACQANDAAGCSSLGTCFLLGRGVEKNPMRARRLFTRGCNMGNQWGCDRLQKMQ
jgi:serine/threonine-protein kinase